MKRLLSLIAIFATLGALVFGAVLLNWKAPLAVPEAIFPAVTLENIFGNQKTNLATADPQKLVTILATGDAVPGRSVNYQTTQKNDFTWSWKEVAAVTKNADLTYINFEVPLVSGCQVTNEGMNFCGDPRQIQGLISGGVDVANLANNHAGDRGVAGIADTKKILEEGNVSATGIGQILYKEVKGTKFAFLGFNDVTSVLNPAPATASTIVDLVKEAKTKADVVIVGFNWGIEYTSQPTTRQRELAHKTIDAGADLILGNHPHWIQPVEIYHGKVITYAHGNFIFDQMWSEKTKEGVIGKYTFSGKQLVDVTFTPIKIRDYGQTYFPAAAESAQTLGDLKAASALLASQPL